MVSIGNGGEQKSYSIRAAALEKSQGSYAPKACL